MKPRLILYDVTGRAANEFSTRTEQLEWEIAEGCKTMQFVMKPSRFMTEADLAAWFKANAGNRISAQLDGREVWRGRVWKMQWQTRGLVLYKDMDRVINAIKVQYSDAENNDLFTDWYEDTVSMGRYGRCETIVSINSVSADEAEGRAKRILKEQAHPYLPYPGITEDRDKTELLVTCWGFPEQANKIRLLPETVGTELGGTGPDGFTTYTQGEELTISEEIYRIISYVEDQSGDYVRYLYPLGISMENTRTTAAGVSSETGAFDRLLELAQVVDLGIVTDGVSRDEKGYRLRIEPDGGAIYERINTAPTYYFYPTVGITKTDRTIPKWEAWPGVLKIIDNYGVGDLPDSLLGDSRLSYVERVAMKEGADSATFHPREYDESDVLQAIDANTRWVEQAREDMLDG